MKLDGLSLADSRPTFGIAALEKWRRTVRVALIPFQQGNQARIFAVAIPTFGTNRVLDSFGRVALLLFSSKPPVDRRNYQRYTSGEALRLSRADLACRADGQACHQPARILDAIAGVFPHDELGRLAETFNHLLKSVDSAVLQFTPICGPTLRTSCALHSRFLHGETELLLSRPRTTEEYCQTLCVFDDEFKKLTRIVEGLFTLSMADAGPIYILIREPLYINEVLEEACALAASRARAKEYLHRAGFGPGTGQYWR